MFLSPLSALFKNKGSNGSKGKTLVPLMFFSPLSALFKNKGSNGSKGKNISSP